MSFGYQEYWASKDLLNRSNLSLEEKRDALITLGITEVNKTPLKDCSDKQLFRVAMRIANEENDRKMQYSIPRMSKDKKIDYLRSKGKRALYKNYPVKKAPEFLVDEAIKSEKATNAAREIQEEAGYCFLKKRISDYMTELPKNPSLAFIMALAEMDPELPESIVNQLMKEYEITSTPAKGYSSDTTTYRQQALFE